MTRPPRSPGNGGHQCRRDGDTDPGPVTAAVALLPASGQAAGQALARRGLDRSPVMNASAYRTPITIRMNR